jgi:hypothetical protein
MSDDTMGRDDAASSGTSPSKQTGAGAKNDETETSLGGRPEDIDAEAQAEGDAGNAD